MSLRFVGVRNSAEKARLLARGTAAPGRFPAADLAYDCIRHADLLERLLEGGDEAELRESLYWRYLVASGRTPEAADAHCREFAGLLATIQREGFDPSREPIAVTDDGVRLNGSHRAAIARAVGLTELDVDVYRWEGAVPAWRTRHIRGEARVKREAQEAFVGRIARQPETGESLGQVVFVDAEVPGRIAGALGRRAFPVVVVERPSGELQRYTADALTLR